MYIYADKMWLYVLVYIYIHWSYGCELVVSECCLAYSQTSRAPLTWTLRERTTPSCGISTQSSSRWIRATGIPSLSLLQGRTGKHTINETVFAIIIDHNIIIW